MSWKDILKGSAEGIHPHDVEIGDLVEAKERSTPTMTDAQRRTNDYQDSPDNTYPQELKDGLFVVVAKEGTRIRIEKVNSPLDRTGTPVKGTFDLKWFNYAKGREKLEGKDKPFGPDSKPPRMLNGQIMNYPWGRGS